MSRLWQIDMDRPLSEEDKAYLMSRQGSQHLVHQNEDRFDGEDAEDDPGPSLEEQVSALKDKELDAALKERNLSTAGKMAERRTRLMAHILENEADEDDDDDDSDDTTES